MTLRHVGTCPVCQGMWKVRNELLVHHGYARPGTGEIYGDCFGVNRPPHELSPATAEAYLRLVVLPELRAAEQQAERLAPPNEPDRLPFEEWNRVTRQHEPVIRSREDVAPHDWERRLDTVRHNAALRLDAMREETRRLESLIASWRPQPLLTVEEAERVQSESKSAQQARVSADREQRSAHALLNLQQRIDRAVKKRDAGELTELFTGGPSKVIEPLGRGASLTYEDVLRLVDRDEVWAALGFMRGRDYIARRDVPSWLDMVHRTDIVWPPPREVPRAAIAQAKAEREAKKQAKLQQSIDDAAAAFRERLDRALRMRDTRAILAVFQRAEMPYEVARKLPDRGRTEMLRLLGSDDVWGAFGWIHPDGRYYDLGDLEALLGPSWDWGPETVPWPRALR